MWTVGFLVVWKDDQVQAKDAKKMSFCFDIWKLKFQQVVASSSTIIRVGVLI